jgi:hypothetical protein
LSKQLKTLSNLLPKAAIPSQADRSAHSASCFPILLLVLAYLFASDPHPLPAPAPAHLQEARKFFDSAEYALAKEACGCSITDDGTPIDLPSILNRPRRYLSSLGPTPATLGASHASPPSTLPTPATAPHGSMMGYAGGVGGEPSLLLTVGSSSSSIIQCST